MAVAMLAIIPAAASADVPRCAAPVTAATPVTFTVTEPAGAEHQFDNVWTHTYTVTVQPDGKFYGTGEITGSDQNGTYDQQVAAHTGADESITGSFGVNTVSYVSTRSDGLTYTLTDARTDGSLITTAALNTPSPYSLEMKITAPLFTAPTTTDMNHGEYVSAAGGGKIAAQKCAGMPKNSAQGVS
jgi:hypothetical protein